MPLSLVILFSIVLNLLLLGLIVGKLFSLYNQVKQRPQQRYSRRCAHFSIKPVSSSDIIFLGDSITEGCEWRTLFPQDSTHNSGIRNFGIGGDTTGGLARRLTTLVEGQPRAIFLLIGTNDIGKNVSMSETISNYRTIVEEIRSYSPNTLLHIQSILPRKHQEQPYVNALNRHVKALAEEYQVDYIDLFTSFANSSGGIDNSLSNDHLHLLGAGYRLWQRLITPYMKVAAG